MLEEVVRPLVENDLLTLSEREPGCAGAGGDLQAGVSTAPGRDTWPHSGAGSAARARSPAAGWSLLTRQNEQFGIGGEDIAHRVLELASSAYARGDAIGPLLGDAVDAVFAAGHKGQGPSDMARVLGISAMTGGSATARVSLSEGARQEALRNRKAAQELKLALAETSRLRALRFAIHL